MYKHMKFYKKIKEHFFQINIQFSQLQHDITIESLDKF